MRQIDLFFSFLAHCSSLYPFFSIVFSLFSLHPFLLFSPSLYILFTRFSCSLPLFFFSSVLSVLHFSSHCGLSCLHSFSTRKGDRGSGMMNERDERFIFAENGRARLRFVAFTLLFSHFITVIFFIIIIITTAIAVAFFVLHFNQMGLFSREISTHYLLKKVNETNTSTTYLFIQQRHF